MTGHAWVWLAMRYYLFVDHGWWYYWMTVTYDGDTRELPALNTPLCIMAEAHGPLQCYFASKRPVRCVPSVVEPQLLGGRGEGEGGFKHVHSRDSTRRLEGAAVRLCGCQDSDGGGRGTGRVSGVDAPGNPV